MNKFLEKGDPVTFKDEESGLWYDGVVLAVHGWAPKGMPDIMVQYVTEGVTVAKFVQRDHVYANGGNGNVKCECGSESVGHSGHAYYCPKS